MKSMKLFAIVFLIPLTACGGGDAPAGSTEPPVIPDRALPAIGGPDGEDPLEVPDDIIERDPETTPPDEDIDIVGGGGDECCNVRFAILDPDGTEDESYVRLVGSASPLLDTDEIDLTYANGVWSVDACVPAGYPGTYHYVFTYLEGDKLGEETVVNEYAPTIEVLESVENDWLEGEDCTDVFAELHSKTDE